jgi:hypothetical protein
MVSFCDMGQPFFFKYVGFKFYNMAESFDIWGRRKSAPPAIKVLHRKP